MIKKIFTILWKSFATIILFIGYPIGKISDWIYGKDWDNIMKRLWK